MNWLQEHGNDMVPVKLIDLLCLIARLEQVADEPEFELLSTEHDRIYTCDIPRLKRYLPAEALAILRDV